jgi:methyl-accepting chemotaxis protein
MKFPQLNTGMRVVASFAVLLLVMACMSGVSLWRLQSANDTASNLVNEKLARQQLTSELLGVTELNGLRAMSIGRSDSLEVSDIFQAQLNAGEKVAAEMERKLAAMPASATKPRCCAQWPRRRRHSGHARGAVQVQGQRPHTGSGRPAR